MSKPSDKASSPDLVWEEGWQGHARKQMELLAALPLSEKLAWLEEAHRLVLHLQSRSSGGLATKGTDTQK